MFYSYSAAALALFSFTSVFAQDSCPDGTNKVTKLLPTDWQNCGIQEADGSFWRASLECSTINVPKDYTDRNAGEIKLRLIRQPARNNADQKNTALNIIMNPGFVHFGSSLLI